MNEAEPRDEADLLTAKELRILTVCVMKHPDVKKMWFKLRRNEKSQPWKVIRAYDGGLMKVEADEIKSLLFKISTLAGVDDDVRKLTTQIFEEELGREAPRL